ncbi:hypothetical protein ROHU_002822 [Labeo rohita]|uniref:Uncharacterized protein n=1 Tax=Labeo rohita TaxID=84645 RepID=A0A498NZ32_LABRO|nr:hypothetical protein ROHU_002822 [Labeo rohita]
MDVQLYVSPQRPPPKRPGDEGDGPLDSRVSCQSGVVPPLEYFLAQGVGYEETSSRGIRRWRILAVALADSLF